MTEFAPNMPPDATESRNESSQRCSIATWALGRRFGARWAVQNLNLKIPQGCVYGFLGLNGAGKSTTIRMLMGLLTPTVGVVNMVGYDPVVDDIEIKRRVGYVPDLPTFYDWMTPCELCALCQHYRREWDAGRAANLLKVFKVPADQKVRTLSKGQRAKISLILALAFNPDVLVLDEPTGGLDPLARRQFIEGVLAEFMEGDRTIFISSHLINEIGGLVDHYGILHEGQVIRTGRVEDLLQSMKRVRLGFEETAPRSCACDGLVNFRANGREALVTIDGFDAERTVRDLSVLRPAQITVEDLTLEEAFVEIVGREESDDEADGGAER